nr:glycoside hydrolase family 3 C-terminal domain-containing protein [Pseudopedobacter sp.]
MKKLLPIFIFIQMSFGALAQNQNLSKAKALVSKMTLEEKVKFLVGKGMKLPGIDLNNGPTVGQTQDLVEGAAGTTFAIPRLNLPTIVLADGPAGLRIQPVRKSQPDKTFYCTAFPIGSLLASSWDTTLVKKVGQAMGSEVKEYGVDILLAPAINIQRNPLGGRNFEYYSEDPVVVGNIAAAMINGIESNGVGTSLKHFAVNNQETNRNLVNTIVSERALREIYLKGFEIAVKKSQPWTVMSSYNKLNGTYTSQEYDLLTTILRKEWGFKGLVMTDWFGGDDAVEQMKAGNDLLMPGTSKQVADILAAIKNGFLSVRIIDENAVRLANLILSSPTFKKYPFANHPDLKAHAIIARNAAADGMVLLKNLNQTLPMHQIKNIAAFGNTSYDFISGGTGSGDVNEAYTISLVDGLKNAGYFIDEDLGSSYSAFIKAEKAKQPPKKFFFELSAPLSEMNINDDLLKQKALSSDIAFITIGRNSGEFQDRKVENDYYLSDAEKALIHQVSIAFHAQNKKLVVILNTGGVMDVSSWRDDADAILLAWQGGQEAGNAVADILSGKVNPSGKLAVTFPANYQEVPSAKYFPGKNLSDKDVKGIGGFSMGYPSEVTYNEGIFVGYRYNNTFHVKPAYEFGYGLSYSNFIYSNLKLSSTNFNGNITATIDITNSGEKTGKEIVQLYLSAPAHELIKPVEELKGFAKTKLLQPKEKQTIMFTLSAKDLASFDSEKSAWVAETGKYEIKIGASSMNIKQRKSFELAKELTVEKVHPVLMPQVQINELKPSK